MSKMVLSDNMCRTLLRKHGVEVAPPLDAQIIRALREVFQMGTSAHVMHVKYKEDGNVARI